MVSSNDPNDPLKANDWFFAVWAYNGASGNIRNDVSSSQYGHWYPGAPFRSGLRGICVVFCRPPAISLATAGRITIYHPWEPRFFHRNPTSLVRQIVLSAALPAQFLIGHLVPMIVAGWVSAPQMQRANEFKTTYASLGGEDVLGLPRDNTGGAAVHRLGEWLGTGLWWRFRSSRHADVSRWVDHALLGIWRCLDAVSYDRSWSGGLSRLPNLDAFSRFLIPAWARIRICARISKRAILCGMRRRICWQ